MCPENLIYFVKVLTGYYTTCKKLYSANLFTAYVQLFFVSIPENPQPFTLDKATT